MTWQLRTLACLCWLLCWPLASQAGELAACTQPLDNGNGMVRLIFPDGQLTNRLTPVFVTNLHLNPAQAPSLRLRETFLSMMERDNRQRSFPALLVDHNQHWSVEQPGIDGRLNTVTYEGTLLLFDLSGFHIHPLRPFVQVMPVLEWNDGDCRQQLSQGQGKVNLGNPIGILLHTLLLTGSVLLLFLAIAARQYGSWRHIVHILCEENGKLSLSKVQMALWTVVIVCVVSAYSQTHITLPEIPWTLIALMGSSYATRALVKWQGAPRAVNEAEDADKEESGDRSRDQMQPRLAHLICDDEGRLSLPRAQMLMWTILTVSIFVVKSLLDGQMWNVPIELVALMGLSQAGYAIPGMRRDTTTG